MDRRIWGVLAAGVAIAAICGWRVTVNKSQSYSEQLAAARIERPAPGFEALDAHNQMFRLQRYLGRHRVLVVFFSAEESAAVDAGLAAVMQAYPQLHDRDIQVVGVSTALPQENRAALAHWDKIPFPLVTDIDLSIHGRWGRLERETGEPLSGVFLIDRKGTVLCYGATPLPAEDVPALIRELTEP